MYILRLFYFLFYIYKNIIINNIIKKFIIYLNYYYIKFRYRIKFLNINYIINIYKIIIY